MGLRRGAVKKQTRAERNVAWCERYIRIPEGRFVGQPLKMADFMVEDFKAIYDNPHGTRRAIISRGRKNAKTTESAMLLLLHLCGPEHRLNSQLFSAAQSREQAGILFSLAAKMVRLSPDLNELVTIRDTAKQLFCPELGTLYRALSAEASTAFGLSPVFTVHDELGQVRGPRSGLYEALETATAAQDQPLSIIISTQAPQPNDLLSVLIDDALAGHDPRTVLRFQSAPDTIDAFSDEAIRSANPAFDVFMNKDEVRAMAQDAKRMPSRQAEYENLVLNRRVEAVSPFVSREVWNNCAGELEDFGESPVWVGLDLSARTDLTAMVIIGRIDGVWHVDSYFWTPENGLADRAGRDRTPYDVWAREGYIRTTPGSTVDYEFVAMEVADILSSFNVQAVMYDRWRIDILKKELDAIGVELPLQEFGQGFKDMSPAIDMLESELLNGRVAHGSHPVLTMCAANAVITKDAAGNRKLDKHKSTGRIDGMVALAMAFGGSSGEVSEDISAFIESPVIG